MVDSNHGSAVAETLQVQSMSPTTSLVRCTQGLAITFLRLASLPTTLRLPRVATATSSRERTDDGNTRMATGVTPPARKIGWECTDATFELDFNETITDDAIDPAGR